MTRKQLQVLISAGVFSAALLSGTAYAETKNKDVVAPSPEQKKSAEDLAPTPNGPNPSDMGGPDTTTVNDGVKQSSSIKKDSVQHGCAGANGCSGK